MRCYLGKGARRKVVSLLVFLYARGYNILVKLIEIVTTGYEVCSVQFTKNGKYLLSSGKDSICRLWEISTGRPILTYTGAELSGRNMHRSNACFNHTEEHVLFPCMYFFIIKFYFNVSYFSLSYLLFISYKISQNFRWKKHLNVRMEFKDSRSRKTLGART